MDEEFKKKLTGSIKKTGYPTELVVANHFNNKSWTVFHNPYFLDEDEKKGIEIDLGAYHLLIPDKNSLVGLHLIIEIKKSSKPWVIFTSGTDVMELYNYMGKFVRSHGFEEDILSDDEKLKFSGIEHVKRIGRTYCEGFKESNDQSSIFKALIKAIKASEYFFELESKPPYDTFWKNINSYVFIEPLIILDGQLIEVYLDKNNALVIEEKSRIPVSFNYLSPNYKENQYIVQIITLNSLENFIVHKGKWLNCIKSKISENRSE